MATPFWYNAALSLIKPLYQWKIRKRALNAEQCQQECLERFGPFQAPKNRHAIWFHVVSVGETNAAQPLIEHYLRLGHAVLVTNTTKTGQARAKALFLTAAYASLFQAVYLPADQKKLVQAFYQKYQPKLLLLMETEIWPNLIDQAKHFNVPCLLINARLSEKSAQGYAKVAALTHGMLSGIDRLLAQDQATLQRYLELGMAPDKAQILGSIKFDIQAPESFIQQAEVLKQQWNLSKRQVITLASTHAPEEQKLLSALKPYLVDYPELLIIIVPRHPERFDAVFQLAQDLPLTTQRRSLGQRIEAESQVYLADSMGEMWLWYALSCVCFVGGSLNEPGGGHNILEPMALNIPTVIGPNYFNFQTIVDELIKADAILLGQEVNQVAAQLIQCVQQPEQAQRLSEHAAAIMQKNSGSLQKHIQVIDEYLAKKPAF